MENDSDEHPVFERRDGGKVAEKLATGPADGAAGEAAARLPVGAGMITGWLQPSPWPGLVD